MVALEAFPRSLLTLLSLLICCCITGRNGVHVSKHLEDRHEPGEPRNAAWDSARFD